MRRSALTLGVLIAVAVVAAQALLIPLFAAPAARLAPRHLPIAVAGPPQLAAQLQAAHPGAFDVTVVADAAAADTKIKDRAAYGAVLVTAAGPEVHIASAASPVVAQLLTQAAATLGPAVPVRDVVPLDPDDPRGAGFGAGFLPLAITSLVVGILVFLFVRGRAARLTALLTFGVLAGLSGAAVLRGWLGIVPGGYLAVAAGLGLFALAVSAAMAGFGALLGRAGLAVGGLTLFLVGNALSGISSAPELLPRPWGALGQWLPVGAGGQVVRSDAYFGGHGAGFSVAVLIAYAVGGLLLILVGGRRLAARPARDVAEATPELVDVR